MFDSTTVMRWLTRFSFHRYACSNSFFLLSVFNILFGFFALKVHWSTVTGGVALAEALRGWSALSWRDAIFRGGSAQRIRSTETTAGESTMGVSQVALVWGKEAASVSPQGGEKSDTTFVK